MESKIEPKKHGVYQKPETKSEAKLEPKIEVVKSSQQTTINIVNTVAIRLIYESKMRYESPITGKSYTWNRIGDVVPVDTEDSDYLLSKRIGGDSCCGGFSQSGNKVFDLA